jgi:hypothetical protein
MKKVFEEASMEIIFSDDVITTSGFGAADEEQKTVDGTYIGWSLNQDE